MKKYILMSDVIDSRLKNQNQLMNDFTKCTKYINQKYAKDILSPLTITLGDEFQGVIKDLEQSIAIIIDLEEFIIQNNFGFKLRYAVVYGEIETKINNEVAHAMLGDGLTSAREQLESMKSLSKRFFVDVKDLDKNIIINNSFQILENIVDNWKINKDYQLITNLIEFKDYKIVAEKLKKERSLIWKREKSLNLSSYNSIKAILKIISKK